MNKILIGFLGIALVACVSCFAGDTMITGVGDTYSGVGTYKITSDGTAATLTIDKIVAGTSISGTISSSTLTGVTVTASTVQGNSTFAGGIVTGAVITAATIQGNTTIAGGVFKVVDTTQLVFIVSGVTNILDADLTTP